MPVWFRVVRLWLPIAVALSAAIGFAYLGIQQNYRSSLDDPQVQLAEDGVTRLNEGASPASVVGSDTVDIAKSLAPFIIILDSKDVPLASSATLHASVPKPPAGVLNTARQKGWDRVTWQPESGVRIASYSAATADGRVVVAGRNMRAVEERISQLGTLALLAWLAGLLGVLVASAAVEMLGTSARR